MEKTVRQQVFTTRHKIFHSALVKRGNVFTVSDMADEIGESREHLSNVLNHLATSGQLNLVSKGSSGKGLPAKYSKFPQGRMLLSQIWDKNLQV